MNKVPKLQFDGLINIAVGKSRKSINWQNEELLWSDFVKKLSVTKRTPETQDDYKKLPRNKRDDIKDVGGFVGGILNNGKRKADSVVNRCLLTLDIDSLPAGINLWPIITSTFNCSAVMYSTHSHISDSPRLRLIMPLSRKVSPDEYTALARRIAGDIGIDYCDDTTYEPNRLMYWPSTPIDGQYVFEKLDAEWLNVDEQLARYHDWRDASEWPVSTRKPDAMKQPSGKQKDPTEKSGIIGAFCRVYSIEDAINTFLQDIYKPSVLENRYDYIPADSSAGLVVYENGKFAYSYHATDPICNRLCNSFDLVRLHKFGALDENAAFGTPVIKLPSYTKMLDFAGNDTDVKKDMAERANEEVITAFDEDEIDDWESKLTINSRGRYESTIENALLILLHNPDLKNKYYYDEFRERLIACGDLPWIKKTDRITDVWGDSDDAGVRSFLEKKYQIDNSVKIRDAIDLAMLKNKRHPVREYLNSLIWDGVKRASTLFIDYLGAADTEYTREVTSKALIGAVARIMSPGCKHDHILVLVGPQGSRKSTTLAKLGKGWFSDSLYTLAGKDAYEQLQGYWIIEMGEMAATRKAELEQIKQFISKQSDNYRSAYARRTLDHPRQCAFFGSTNDDEFLRDPTGARRFWPVDVTNAGRLYADKLTDEIIDQIWAEAVVRYKSGEKWYLNESMENIARDVQMQHTETNGKQGSIEKFLSRPLPKDWEKRKLNDRIIFLDGGFGEDESPDLVQRNHVCALEIWQELFRNDVKNYTLAQAREITGILRQIKGWKFYGSVNCGEPYGKQRAFVREIQIYATSTKTHISQTKK